MQLKIELRQKIFFVFIISVFIMILLYLNSTLNIWEDEVYSLKSTSGNVSTTIKQALNFEGQPPVYFVLLNLWRHIDNSIFFSRLFSLLAIVTSSIVMLKIARAYIPESNPMILLSLFLFNPFVIWASTEIRHYAFSILISILLLFFFHKAYLSGEKKKIYKALYFITAFISFYTFYYFSFFLFTNGIFLFLKKRYKEFLYYCIVMVITILPLVFLYNIFLNQFALHYQSLIPPSGIKERLTEVGKGTQNYLFAMWLVPFGTVLKTIYKLSIFSILIFGLYKILKKDYLKKVLKNDSLISFLFSIVLIYFIYLILLNVFPRLYFTERYLIQLYPLLTIFSVLFIWNIFTKKWIKESLLLIMLFIFIISDYEQFKIPVKKYDYKETASYLKKEIKDSRPILFYRGAITPIFYYYYNGPSKLYPLPDSSCYTTNFLAYIKDVNEFDSILNSFHSSKFCLVADEQIDKKYSVDYNRPLLYDFIRKKYIIEKDTNFYGRAKRYYSRITEFRLPVTMQN